MKKTDFFLMQLEKERQRSSEDTSKFLLEKSSLGRSLTKMEIENTTLQEKVQNLQVIFSLFLGIFYYY